MSLYNILKKPIFTEKASSAELLKNCYVFQVATSATKIDVKKAIMEMYGVKVASVNIVNTIEKYKYGRKGIQYKRRPGKKAYVTLEDKKAKIDFTIIK
ncbi:MAG: 50S ribosomal protein L23 [Candidatus Gracilibacteria bacterium]|nr:50S ribosomal protein L23 [Candidatus Gracilibacteria bacterium]